MRCETNTFDSSKGVILNQNCTIEVSRKFRLRGSLKSATDLDIVHQQSTQKTGDCMTQDARQL